MSSGTEDCAVIEEKRIRARNKRMGWIFLKVKNKYFNLKEGTYQPAPPDHQYFMDEVYSEIFFRLSTSKNEPAKEIRISASRRDHLLEMLLLYYKFHVPGFTGLKSHLVLHSVLS